ncbi:MAG TPA: Xaa-Pro aminopeptidase [Gammaproteobacteria bacterium]|nr:Xaa-Pro aminopeptidase [Gammaproteobacteria bacterium]
MTGYAMRRLKILSLLGNNAMAIIPAKQPVIRNNDTEYPYRQDSDFYYLTGFEEGDALLVLYNKNQASSFTLFCKRRDPLQERWTGPLLGPEGAKNELGADSTFDISQIDSVMPILLQGIDKVWFPLGKIAGFDEKVLRWREHTHRSPREGKQTFSHILDIGQLLHASRVVKDREEIAKLRYAAKISAKAHQRLMTSCHPGMMEYELEAEFLHECVRQGCRQQAYPPIIAGGKNACILHYVQNNQKLQDGDLVLVDAGAEYQNYASDISRTFPVNGKFSKPQQAVYELVLSAQMGAIEKAKPGGAWDNMQQAILEVMVPGLVDLGILEGDPKEIIAKGDYKKFYMHHSGHWLGLDVHDVGAYKENDVSRILQPGMVFTVEPGIYLPPDCQDIPEKWRGIGVRIEDDILVTQEGSEVLSQGVPKRVKDIEKIMNKTSYHIS